MPTFTINNVRFSGLISCVPLKKINNLNDCSLDLRTYREKVCKSTGIYERRICPEGVCFSDLAKIAAEKLIHKLDWQTDEVEALIIVSQSPDYPTPSTAIILQDKLGLSTKTIAYDVNLGCSGYPFGLHLLASLVTTGAVKKGVVLVGDKSASLHNPLFSDAATATALEYDENAPPCYFDLNSDGSGHKNIIVPAGAHREPLSFHHLIPTIQPDGSTKRYENFILNGPAVYKFAVHSAPESIKKVIQKSGKNIEKVDYIFLHQANKLINKTIADKLQLSETKFPSSLREFGNTSGASIPLTMTTQVDLNHKSADIIMCGYGVGLSWGSCMMNINNAIFPDLIEV